MLSHIGVDNFFGGGVDVLVASGRKRHVQKKKWRARKRKRTLRRKWNPAGPNRSWRRQQRQSRTPPPWRRLRWENWGGWGSWITAGSQASWTPNQSLYEVSTSSSDVFCFIPLSQSGLLPLCLPDWKQISKAKTNQKHIFDYTILKSLLDKFMTSKQWNPSQLFLRCCTASASFHQFSCQNSGLNFWSGFFSILNCFVLFFFFCFGK